jgi:isochorismate pyruvate lyase
MPTPELRALRDEIDAVDQGIAELLARRFRIVDHVIAVKNSANLPAVLSDRIEQVVCNARSRSEQLGIPSETMERLWRLLIAETIRYEDAHLRNGAPPSNDLRLPAE